MTKKYIHKELIPLDIDYIANYLWDSRPKAYNEEGYKENIKKLLSKYGVHKQEEKVSKEWLNNNTDTKSKEWNVGHKIFNAIEKHVEERKQNTQTGYILRDIIYELVNNYTNPVIPGVERTEEYKGPNSEKITPTPQATSVIDVEEVVGNLADLIDTMIATYSKRLFTQPVERYNKEMLKTFIKNSLSSLPIVQKKRSEEDVFDWLDPDGSEMHLDGLIIKQITQFLKDNNLYQD